MCILWSPPPFSCGGILRSAFLGEQYICGEQRGMGNPTQSRMALHSVFSYKASHHGSLRLSTILWTSLYPQHPCLEIEHNSLQCHIAVSLNHTSEVWQDVQRCWALGTLMSPQRNIVHSAPCTLTECTTQYAPLVFLELFLHVRALGPVSRRITSIKIESKALTL